MKKLLIRRVSIFILCCFLSMIISDSYPLYGDSERDGVLLIEKGEAEYRDGYYREALDFFKQAFPLIHGKKNKERLLLDIALVQFALGENEKSQAMIVMLLDENPASQINRGSLPKGFLQIFDRAQALVKEQTGEQEKLTQEKRIEEQKAAEEKLGAEKENKELQEKLEEQKRVEESRLAMEKIELEKERKEAEKKASKLAKTKESVKSDNALPSVQEKENPALQIKKKKKFPWLLAIAGAVVVGALVYFLVIKKPKYNLNVNLGTGVQGTPGSGVYEYKKGDRVSYSYSLASSGYKDLTVSLDGSVTSASGSFTMDADRKLTITASEVLYTLQVSFDSNKITGSPAAGTYTHRSGTVVNYSFAVKTGFSNLQVTLNNSIIGNSGTITMNENKTLAATVTTNPTYDIRGSWNINVMGAPPYIISTVTFSGTDTSGKVSCYSLPDGTYSVTNKSVSFGFPTYYAWSFDGTFQSATYVTGTWGCYHASGSFTMTKK